MESGAAACITVDISESILLKMPNSPPISRLPWVRRSEAELDGGASECEVKLFC